MTTPSTAPRTTRVSASGLRLVIIIGFTSLLSACQSVAPGMALPGQSVQEQVALREAALARLDTFSFTGGLGIWTDQESIPARIHWQQTPARLQLVLSGPLGIGDMDLVETDGLAVLTRGNETMATGPSADGVIQQALGLSAPVPVDQLKQWVRGLPGSAKSVKRDAEGKLVSLGYRDTTGTRWEARFKRYTKFNDTTLPELITASGGPFSIRLVLKNWQLDAKPSVPEVKESYKRLPIPRR